jgi:hypothetical protein
MVQYIKHTFVIAAMPTMKCTFTISYTYSRPHANAAVGPVRHTVRRLLAISASSGRDIGDGMSGHMQHRLRQGAARRGASHEYRTNSHRDAAVNAVLRWEFDSTASRRTNGSPSDWAASKATRRDRDWLGRSRHPSANGHNRCIHILRTAT